MFEPPVSPQLKDLEVRYVKLLKVLQEVYIFKAFNNLQIIIKSVIIICLLLGKLEGRDNANKAEANNKFNDALHTAHFNFCV